MRNIIGMIVGAFCIYLLGAFIEVTFDISQWSRDLRHCVALFMPIGAMAGMSIVIAHES